MSNLCKSLFLSTTALLICTSILNCMDSFSERAYSNTDYSSSETKSLINEINQNNNTSPIDLKNAAEQYSDLKKLYNELCTRFENKIKILQHFIKGHNELLKKQKK